MSFNKKPVVGLLAFVVVLFTMPLGHTLMILMEIGLGENEKFISAFLLGLVGFVMLIVGMKQNNEASATWLGLFAGLLMWTGWVEFSFVYFAQKLSIAPEMVNGEIVTKAEYLILPSSIGILLSFVGHFMFSTSTQCNFFIWIQKYTGFSSKRKPAIKERNYARITATETIFVVWIFYVLLMVAYDKTIFGDQHIFTKGIFIGSLLWSGFLIGKLLKYNNIGGAIRYAIPTVVIFGNAVEILGRWDMFEEFWVEPQKYQFEILIVLGLFVGTFLIAVFKTRVNKICIS
jgi:hypothetical protein